jgi:hypothetical protein
VLTTVGVATPNPVNALLGASLLPKDACPVKGETDHGFSLLRFSDLASCGFVRWRGATGN